MVTLLAATVVAARASTAVERKVEAIAGRVEGRKSDKGMGAATEGEGWKGRAVLLAVGEQESGWFREA
jgi:hypothetical protein